MFTAGSFRDVSSHPRSLKTTLHCHSTWLPHCVREPPNHCTLGNYAGVCVDDLTRVRLGGYQALATAQAPTQGPQASHVVPPQYYALNTVRASSSDLPSYTYFSVNCLNAKSEAPTFPFIPVAASLSVSDNLAAHPR